jgi:hypothetical protein
LTVSARCAARHYSSAEQAQYRRPHGHLESLRSTCRLLPTTSVVSRFKSSDISIGIRFTPRLYSITRTAIGAQSIGVSRLWCEPCSGELAARLGKRPGVILVDVELCWLNTEILEIINHQLTLLPEVLPTLQRLPSAKVVHARQRYCGIMVQTRSLYTSEHIQRYHLGRRLPSEQGQQTWSVLPR